MILTKGNSKIVGLQTARAETNITVRDRPPLAATFNLTTVEGGLLGRLDKAGGWSERTLEALRVLLDSMEADALGDFFEVAEAEVPEKTEESKAEPPQF
jgi:hypothetical protein